MTETEVRPVTRLQWVVQISSASLLLWLYGGDLLDALRVPGAAVAAFVHPPSVGFAGPVVALTLGAVGAAGYGHWKKLGAAWKGHRLLPIITVVVLFVDLFVVASTRTPFSAPDKALFTVHEFARLASEQSTPTRVLTSDEALQPLLKDFGAPPYLVRGVALKEWKLEVRPTCEGPATEVGGAGAGTLLYCANAAGNAGWVSAVGLPFGVRFGDPQILSRADLPVAAEVSVKTGHSPEDDPGAIEELPMEESRWGDPDDAGEPVAPAEDAGP